MLLISSDLPSNEQVLDDEDTPENLKCPTLYAVVRLCAASGAYPQCLVLEGIRCREDQPVASGRFGEIWKGYFGDHPVSLKVARLDQRDKIEHFTKVCLRLLHYQNPKLTARAEFWERSNYMESAHTSQPPAVLWNLPFGRPL